MDNIKDQALYENCKKIVKQWEFDFTAKKGRVPSKLDIREADKYIREAYRTYFRLKTAVLMNVVDFENDLQDSSEICNDKDNLQSEIENETELKQFDEESDQIWGKHLNKNQEEIKKPEEETKTPKVINSFTKKLFNNSKFMKRNPRSRSSLNLTRSNSLEYSQNNLSLSESLSQPNPIISDSDEKVIPNFNCTLPVLSDSNKSVSQPVNFIDRFLNNSISVHKRNVDKGWLHRTSITTGIAVSDENVKEISESNIICSETVQKCMKQPMFENKDIISDSDEDDSLTFHPLKRRKLSDTCDFKKSPELLKPNHNIKNTVNVNVSILADKKLNNIENNEKMMHKNGLGSDVAITDNTPKVNTKQNHRLENQKDESIDPDNNHDYHPKEFKKGLKRGRKKVQDTNTIKENKEEHQKDESSDPDNDPDYHPIEIKTSLTRGRKKVQDTGTVKENVKKSTSKRKRGEKLKAQQLRTPAPRRVKNKSEVNNIQEITENDTEETETYELEYSVKPPPKTVPRIKNLPRQISDENSDTEKNEASKALNKNNVAEKKLRKKIAAGTLNDNFVRIDMKKKVYVRGKKHMNFTKYKKNLWKSKKKALCGLDMDMGGCDGGMLTCFKCGKTGHFARECKAPSDKLLPLDADEEICPYPSLEEASEMASQSVLAVHTPNIPSKIKMDLPSLEELKNDESSNKSEKENNQIEDDNTSNDDEFEDDPELESFMANSDSDIMNYIQSSQPSLEYIDPEKNVQPLYNLNPDGSLQDTPNEVFEALSLFGHESFRDGQEEAIMRILSGKSTLVTLSTGSGKSLCYQLPAYLYAQKSNCISLVISPLVSLMDDQVSGMPAFLKAACLHTLQTSTQKEKVLKLIEAGNLNILLLSPEAITAGEKLSGFGSILRKLPPIAFACIDEAHCVSHWSHNFRPSYLMICHVLRERLGIRTILGLTATSTYATGTNIVEHLQIPDGHKGIISDIPLPDNLHLSVSSDQMRDAAMKNLLTSEPYVNYDSIIVYCTRREECERVASYLRTTITVKPIQASLKKYKSLHPVAEPYHAGLAASRRKTVQNAFMGGYLRIVVATVAFGMGINKSDIRSVIHYNVPKSFESYVQEVGRSGRDGLPSNCHVFLNHEGKDINELKRHIYSNSMDRHVIRKLLKKVFIPCSCTKVCPRHEVAFSVEEIVQDLDVPEENIATLLCYLELHEKRYIEVLTKAYIVCKIIAYGGAQHIKKAASDCPPLAMALALHKNKSTEDNVFEFPVVDVASAMGWDSGIVKHKLKNLEWINENGQPKRSKLSVQFLNLGFRLRAPGNLSSFELDQTLENLHAKVLNQEETSLRQLQVVHSTLSAAAESSYYNCLLEAYTKKSDELKAKIRKYFSCEDPLKDVKIIQKSNISESQIISDIRSLVAMYRDNKFSGRAIARIFYGIQSPNYPAVIWGRCKFWRSHLDVDFKQLCEIANAEILKLR